MRCRFNPQSACQNVSEACRYAIFSVQYRGNWEEFGLLWRLCVHVIFAKEQKNGGKTLNIQKECLSLQPIFGLGV